MQEAILLEELWQCGITLTNHKGKRAEKIFVCNSERPMLVAGLEPLYMTLKSPKIDHLTNWREDRAWGQIVGVSQLRTFECKVVNDMTFPYREKFCYYGVVMSLQDGKQFSREHDVYYLANQRPHDILG